MQKSRKKAVKAPMERLFKKEKHDIYKMEVKSGKYGWLWGQPRDR